MRLRNALAQTGWTEPDAAAVNWREALLELLRGLDWERPEDRLLLTRENLERVVI